MVLTDNKPPSLDIDNEDDEKLESVASSLNSNSQASEMWKLFENVKHSL